MSSKTIMSKSNITPIKTITAKFQEKTSTILPCLSENIVIKENVVNGKNIINGDSLEKTFSLPLSAEPKTLKKLLKKFLKIETKNLVFFVNGKILDSNLLEMHKNGNLGVSGEDVLVIEYVLPYPPPNFKQRFVLNDWISSCEFLQDGKTLICGDFSGKLNVAKMTRPAQKNNVVFETNSHSIKDLHILSQNNDTADIITSGRDFSRFHFYSPVKLWEYQITQKTMHSLQTFKTAGNCHSIQSRNDKIITGGTENAINFYRFEKIRPISAEDKKIDESRNEESSEEHLKHVFRIEKAHEDCVSSVCFSSEISFCSGSWDRSIKKWDVGTEKAVSAFDSEDVVTCLNFDGQTGLMASAHASRGVCLWDLRYSKSENPVFSLRADCWQSSVRFKSTNVVVSCGHDGLVRFWDLRACADEEAAVLVAKKKKKLFCLGVCGDAEIAEVAAGGEEGVFTWKK